MTQSIRSTYKCYVMLPNTRYTHIAMYVTHVTHDVISGDATQSERDGVTPRSFGKKKAPSVCRISLFPSLSLSLSLSFTSNRQDATDASSTHTHRHTHRQQTPELAVAQASVWTQSCVQCTSGQVFSSLCPHIPLPEDTLVLSLRGRPIAGAVGILLLHTHMHTHTSNASTRQQSLATVSSPRKKKKK